MSLADISIIEFAKFESRNAFAVHISRLIAAIVNFYIVSLSILIP